MSPLMIKKGTPGRPVQQAVSWLLILAFSSQAAGLDEELLSRLGAGLREWLNPSAYAAETESAVVVTSPKYSDFVWTARRKRSSPQAPSASAQTSLPAASTPGAPACHNSNNTNGPGINRWEQVTPGGVNLSNGDFVLSHRDLILPERGLSLEIVRTYNSQPPFELPGWVHETNRGGSSWFIDQGSLRGEGDRILTERVFQNPVTVTVRMKTVQTQPGEADVPDLNNPDQPAFPSSWYAAWVNFGYQDYRNFYYFLIHRDGTLELSKLSGGSLVTLKTSSSSLKPFDWHTVKVEVSGATIRCSVDGALLLQYTDTVAIPSGKVGLNAYWCHALFDDLSVTDSQGTFSDDFNRQSRPEQSIFGWGWTWNYGLKVEGTQLITASRTPLWRRALAWFTEGVTAEAGIPPGLQPPLTIVFRSDGGHNDFTPSAPAGNPQTFIPPPGCYGQLYKSPDGSSRYREKDGLLREFDAQGRHTRMADRNGNAITLTYDSQGRPVTITGPTGLQLQLAYGANGKVSSVTDPQGRVVRYGYDSVGHLTSVTDPLGGVVRYTYYSSHSMAGWSDKSGHATSNTYWYNNRVGSQTDPLLKTTHFEYWWDNSIVVNARGERWTYFWKEGQWDKPTRIVDPSGKAEGYAWDDQGNRIGITNRNGHLTAFEYDAHGNPTRAIRYLLEQQILTDTRMTYDPTFNEISRTVDSNGNVTTFEYDTNGNLLKTAKSLGSTSLVTQMTYDSSGELLSVKDPLLNVARYEYDSHGRRTAAVDPMGNRTTFTYDPVGRLLTTTDPLGHTMTNTYDAVGDLLTVQNSLSHTITYTYDADGRVLTTTDPNSRVTKYEYDAMGHPVRVTDPLGAVTITGYDSTRFLHLGSAPKISETDPLGNTTTLFCDAYDRPVTVTDPLGNKTTTAYDAFGNVLSQTDPEGRTTSFTYDPLNRRITITDALGNVTQMAYDPNGNTTGVTDANGHITRYEYDGLNRRVAVVEPISARTTYAYDALNHLVKVTNALGNVTQMTYDVLGRKVAMDDPDMGHWTYAYDALGNLLSQTDAKGQVLTFAYDALSRVTLKKGLPPQGTVAVILASYLYDAASKAFCVGRLSKVTDPNGSTELFYDAVGRPVKMIKKIGAQTFIVQRAYDLKGQLTRLTYPDGEVVRYTYDAAGRPIHVEGAQIYVDRAEYNKASQLSRSTYGNQLVTDYTYDGTGHLQHLVTAQGRLQDLAYTFDGVGNILAITDKVGTATQRFTYDELDRLTQAVGASYGARTYRYNAIGNLLDKDGITYTYGQGGTKPHAVTAGSDGFRGIYDANGNLVTKNDQTLTYDLENRLSGVTRTVYAIQRPLQSGWNFVGVPFDPLGGTVEEVLAPLKRGTDYDQVSRFNAQGQTYEHSVGDSRYDQFTTMSRGAGYQVYVTNPAGATLKIKGLLPKVSGSLSLATGWNLLGNPKPQSAAVKDLLSSYTVGSDYNQAARYNPSTKQYDRYKGQPGDPFQALLPTEAFFLSMRHPADWALAQAVASGDVTASQETVEQFLYDADGGRVQQVTSTATTQYVGGLYETQTTSDGTTLSKHIFLGAMRVATRRTGLNAGTYFNHPDHLGSASLVTDSKGQVAQTLEYLPFGSVWKKSGTVDLAQKFNGKPLDTGTGFYYYGARYYDPELGRWITPDSTISDPFNPQTLNRYSYVDNNPLKYTDPTGHKKFWKKVRQFIGKVVGAVAAAVTFAVTGGNIAAAYAVFNLVDSVTTAAVNGGDIGRAIAGAIVSTALNFALPGAGSTNFLINAGVDAVRQATISAVTAAVTGGDPARAALGGLVSGAAGVIPYVGPIVGGGAAAEVQGGKFATGAIGAGVGMGTFAGTSFLLAKLAQSGNLQAAVDGGHQGADGPSADKAIAQSALRRGQGGEGAFVQRWVGEGPLTVTKGPWEVQGTWPPEDMISHMPMPGARIIGVFERDITYTQSGHFDYLGGRFIGESYTRTWSDAQFRNVPGTLVPNDGELIPVFDGPSDQ